MESRSKGSNMVLSIGLFLVGVGLGAWASPADLPFLNHFGLMLSGAILFFAGQILYTALVGDM